MKCLQKEPRKRYATAKEMADDLNRYLVGEPIRARRTPPVERAVKWAQAAPDQRHPARPSRSLGVISLARHRRVVLEPPAGPGTSRRADTRPSCRKRRPTTSSAPRRPSPKNDLNQGHEVLTTRKNILEREKQPRAREPLRSDQADARGSREGPGSRPCAAGRATGEGRGPEALSSSSSIAARRRSSGTRSSPASCCRRTSTSPARRPRRPWASSHTGSTTDDWTLGDLPASLSSEQQAEVREGCYELLLVLAEAVAGQDPAQVDRALRVLESADRLRPDHSRAYHLRKASLPGAEERSGRRGSGARRGRARPPRDRLRLFPERPTRVQAPPVGRCDPGFRDRPAEEARPLLGQMPAGHLLYPDDAVRSGEVVLERLPPDRPRLRLALSPARLRQRPARRQVSRAWSRAVRARGRTSKASAEFEFEEAEADFQRGPRATQAHARRRAPVRAPGQPRPHSIPARPSRSGRRRLPGGHPIEEGPVPGPCRARSCLSEARQDRPRRSSSSPGPSPSSRTGRRSIAGGPRSLQGSRRLDPRAARRRPWPI